jgi:histidinol-phosphatase
MELADTAGQLAMERFRAPDLTVQIKEDGSPVTDADREIERVLREQIAQQRPEHAITGEEYGDSGESQWRWYLDPIDGTTSYVEGGENWKTLIALTRAGRLELAVVDAPASAARWWAVRDQGAFRDGERLRVSTTR